MRQFAKAVYTVFFLLPATIMFAQNQKNDSLLIVVAEMESNNIYEMSYTVGYAGSVSKQYLRFRQLLSLATENELMDLATNHKNAVVRLYAFQALKYKRVSVPETLARQFANDTTQVNTLYGCEGGVKKISFLAQQELDFTSNKSIKPILKKR